MTKITKKLLDSGRLPNAQETTLFEMRLKYVQDADDCATEDINELTIETQDAGDGPYYVLSTKRFAFDNPDEIVEILNDFIIRFTNNKK